MRIVAAMDGSQQSLRALPHVALLAQAADAELMLVRVLDPRDDALAKIRSSPHELEALAARWTEELREIAAPLDARATAHVVTAQRSEGVANALVRASEESHARLIGLASRGTGILRRALGGSVAAGVLARSPLPVMLVGEQAGTAGTPGLYHMLVATDGSQGSQAILPGLRRVFEDAPRANARLTLLRIYVPTLGDPPRREALEECRRQLSQFRRRAPRRFPVDVEVRVQESLGGVHSAILQFAEQGDVDSIWMSTRGHSFRRQVLLGSTALRIAQTAKVPVVLTRASPLAESRSP